MLKNKDRDVKRLEEIYEELKTNNGSFIFVVNNIGVHCSGNKEFLLNALGNIVESIKSIVPEDYILYTIALALDIKDDE